MQTENAVMVKTDQVPMIQQKPLSANEIRAQVNLIQEVMEAVMKEGTHFGKIPGCEQPALFKAGAEKLFMTFHIGVLTEVSDLSTDDEARFRVTARATKMSTGETIGASVGECSSHEEKYKWRRAVCDEEWNEAPEDRRRRVWKKGKEGKPNYQIAQVRTNKADVANTILKMAEKRANVGLALKVTAASDIFTQDVEDMDETTRESVVGSESNKTAPPMPQRKSEAAKTNGNGAANATQTVRINVAEIKSEPFKSTQGKDLTRYHITAHDGTIYKTIDNGIAEAAEQAGAEAAACDLTFKVSQWGNDIVSLKVLEQKL